jgi:predicted 3-demethylubiquinone-9 3-methyltransferase (glyoxalase superfamily)
VATKETIRQADIDALTKTFCLGCGHHLGAVKAHPWTILNQGLYDLISTQFLDLIEQKGWTFGELKEAVRIATNEKRLLRLPSDAVSGLLPASKRKDTERNLIPGEDLYFHPLLQVRRMPCLVHEDGETTVVSEGYISPFIDSFTMQELLDYWNEKISPGREQETLGSLSWILDRYGLSTTLHAIDRLADSMTDERSTHTRSNVDVFQLKQYVLEEQNDREESTKWN